MFNVEKIRNDFPMIKNAGCIYFDNSATSFKPQCVIDRVSEYYTNENCNIHRGDYDLSVKVSKEYDDTRKTIKKFINCRDKNEIVFTHGATSSLNTVAYGYGLSHLSKGDVILTSQVEHASNILPWFRVSDLTEAEIRYIPFDEDAKFNLEKYEECFKDRKVKIVSLTYVSNVMGYKYPMKDIVRIAHKYGALVNCDGAQAVPHMKVDVEDLDVDFLSFSSHKMCGPAGIGVLYAKYKLLQDMDPVWLGGGSNARFKSDKELILKESPDKFESGSPCIEGVLGLDVAARYLMDIGMENIEAYESELSEYLVHRLSELKNVHIYNRNTDTAIVSFNVDGIFAQDTACYLNANKFALRSGNHCAKLLIDLIGTNESVRASLYFYNTKEEIDRFVECLKDITLEKCIEAAI